MKILSALFALCLFFTAAPAHAQGNTNLPTLPDPIKTLVTEGAQIRYLGREHGFDSWLTIKNGQEQYFYVLPDRSAFLSGILYDETGKLVTLRQLRKLREKSDPILDALMGENFAGMNKADTGDDESAYEFKTPAERLFADIEQSNWVPLGAPNAPAAYAFIDPQCPHCHSFIEDLKEDYITKGTVQIRIIPVGFKDETRAQAAFLMAAPNPQERWFKHMGGDETALPAKSEINQQGVQRNMAILQAWKFDVTPLIIYRGKDGGVKIIRGKPKDIKNFVSDLSTAR